MKKEKQKQTTKQKSENGSQKTEVRNQTSDIRGITIIALIITIVIMLILAGVSINFAINGNLINQAGKAVKKTNEKVGQTQDRVDELMGELDDITLVLSDHIKIGDYVQYTPETVTEPYEIAIEHSGYDNVQEITQDTKLKWRVLSVDDENRTIELISETPTSNSIGFKGARGYNNCVYLLNDACKYLYSNEAYGATARSINIEDIQERMDLSVWDYHDYDGSGVKYGDTFTYGGNQRYPKQWLNDAKTGAVSSTQESLIAYSTEEDAYEAAEGGKLTVINGSWTQSDMSDKYINADARKTEENSNMYYQLIHISGKFYWVATRCVFADSGYSYACFGLRYVANGIKFSERTLCGSTSRTNSITHQFRPIVTLSYNHINLKAGYDETNGWGVK